MTLGLHLCKRRQKLLPVAINTGKIPTAVAVISIFCGPWLDGGTESARKRDDGSYSMVKKILVLKND